MTTNPMLPLTVVARKKCTGVLDAKLKLLAFLEAQNIPYQIDDHPNTLSGLDPAQIPHPVSLTSVQHGLLVSIGGDGSLLRLVPQAAANQVPIIGINLGQLGFLADLSMDDLSTLSAIIDGHCIKDARALVDATLIRDHTETPLGVGLNELCIKSEKPGRALAFSVTVQQRRFNYRADGFIVATPTGSTAYALSSGGPIIIPDIDAHLLLPVCPHMLNIRPIIIPANSPITIQLDEKSHRTATLLLDGSIVGTLSNRDQVVIQQAKQSVTLIHPEHYDFMDVTINKLHWKSD